jgi:fructose-bisphosphate aldolase class 1
MDKLECLPYPGIDTLLKAFKRQCNRIPDHEWLGTRTNDHYTWISFKQVQEYATKFAAGCMKLGLVPEIEGEG